MPRRRRRPRPLAVTSVPSTVSDSSTRHGPPIPIEIWLRIASFLTFVRRRDSSRGDPDSSIEFCLDRTALASLSAASRELRTLLWPLLWEERTILHYPEYALQHLTASEKSLRAIEQLRSTQFAAGNWTTPHAHVQPSGPALLSPEDSFYDDTLPFAELDLQDAATAISLFNHTWRGLCPSPPSRPALGLPRPRLRSLRLLHFHRTAFSPLSEHPPNDDPEDVWTNSVWWTDNPAPPDEALISTHITNAIYDLILVQLGATPRTFDWRAAGGAQPPESSLVSLELMGFEVDHKLLSAISRSPTLKAVRFTECEFGINGVSTDPSLTEIIRTTEPVRQIVRRELALQRGEGIEGVEGDGASVYEEAESGTVGEVAELETQDDETEFHDAEEAPVHGIVSMSWDEQEQAGEAFVNAMLQPSPAPAIVVEDEDNSSSDSDSDDDSSSSSFSEAPSRPSPIYPRSSSLRALEIRYPGALLPVAVLADSLDYFSVRSASGIPYDPRAWFRPAWWETLVEVVFDLGPAADQERWAAPFFQSFQKHRIASRKPSPLRSLTIEAEDETDLLFTPIVTSLSPARLLPSLTHLALLRLSSVTASLIHLIAVTAPHLTSLHLLHGELGGQDENIWACSTEEAASELSGLKNLRELAWTHMPPVPESDYIDGAGFSPSHSPFPFPSPKPQGDDNDGRAVSCFPWNTPLTSSASAAYLVAALDGDEELEDDAADLADDGPVILPYAFYPYRGHQDAMGRVAAANPSIERIYLFSDYNAFDCLAQPFLVRRGRFSKRLLRLRGWEKWVDEVEANEGEEDRWWTVGGARPKPVLSKPQRLAAARAELEHVWLVLHEDVSMRTTGSLGHVMRRGSAQQLVGDVGTVVSCRGWGHWSVKLADILVPDVPPPAVIPLNHAVRQERAQNRRRLQRQRLDWQMRDFWLGLGEIPWMTENEAVEHVEWQSGLPDSDAEGVGEVLAAMEELLGVEQGESLGFGAQLQISTLSNSSMGEAGID